MPGQTRPFALVEPHASFTLTTRPSGLDRVPSPRTGIAGYSWRQGCRRIGRRGSGAGRARTRRSQRPAAIYSPRPSRASRGRPPGTARKAAEYAARLPHSDGGPRYVGEHHHRALAGPIHHAILASSRGSHCWGCLRTDVMKRGHSCKDKCNAKGQNKSNEDKSWAHRLDSLKHLHPAYIVPNWRLASKKEIDVAAIVAVLLKSLIAIRPSQCTGRRRYVRAVKCSRIPVIRP